ncbi:MAG: sulfatase [Planctomycetes bacterium]|nr:sulfatase [Planctomycetota bacterium]
MPAAPRRLAAALLLLVAPAPAQEQQAATPRPNLVVFLVDDLGWQDLSVPMHRERTPFNDHFRTPSVERLAATGVRLTASYACAVCSPSRTSLLTGRNAARHHVTQWTLRPGQDPSQRARGLRSPDWSTEGLQPGIPTLPALLREQGYRTIHVGKAHFGALGTPGADPRALGFDENVAGHAAGGPGSYLAWHDFSAAWRNGDRIWDVPGLERWHGRNITLTEALTIEACERVRRAVADGQPFFLYLAHYAVHAPLEEHAPWAARYRESGSDEREARYASMVEAMDQSLGAVLFTLDELGVAEHTLVVFTSDNGGLCFNARGRTPAGTGDYTHNAPLRSGKGSAYDGGTRVPTLVAWARPARGDDPVQSAWPLQPGRTIDEPVLIDDWLPTLCHLAGLDATTRCDPLDGHDLTPLLTDPAPWHRPTPLVWHFPHFHNHSDATLVHGYSPHSAMRKGRYKVVHFYDRGIWELYDLATDLAEQHDLAATEPALLRTLATELVDRLDALGAQYPLVEATGAERRPVLPD